MFENLAEQMIQKKQLRTNKNLEEDLAMEKRKVEFSRAKEVTEKSLKLDVQATKTKNSSTVRMKAFRKKINKIVVEVHNERNATENAMKVKS